MAAAAARADTPPATAEISFEKQVQPFFKAYCTGCHNGGDEGKGGLNLLSYTALMEGGDSGAAVSPGKSNESRLVRLLTGVDKPKMPPKDAKQPPPDEIELIKRWIDQGAKDTASGAAPAAPRGPPPHIAPRVPITAAIAAVAFSPDGKWLAAARFREVLLFDAATGGLTQTLVGSEHPINAVAFSPDSRSVIAGEGPPGVSGAVRTWRLDAPEPRTFNGHADSIYGVAFQPGGTLLATASYDKLLILWDFATGVPQHTLKHHTAAVFGCSFSPDGKTLASVSADQTVKLWNVETGQRVLTLTEPTKSLNCVAFHPRGHEFVAAGSDKMLRVWDWTGTSAPLKKSSVAHDAPILAVAYAPDGNTLFTASEDRRIKAWDAATLRERHVYNALPDWPLALAVSPDGARLAAGFFNGDLTFFATDGPQVLKPLLTGIRRVVASAEPPPAAAAPVPAGEAPANPNPPAPRLDAITPRTVARNSTVRLTLAGQNLWEADRVFVQPATLSPRLLPGDAKSPQKATVEIDLPADFTPGMIQLRLHTPLGSTDSKSVYVGPFAETGEKEPNNEPGQATPATFPATLTGAVNQRADRDFWSFDAAAGQELVFVLVGSNLGSALAPRLTICDAAGAALAVSHRDPLRRDALLGRRFDEPGKYLLLVEDRNATGGGGHFYSIHAGALPYAVDSFPFGLRAAGSGTPLPGEPAAIEVRGFNLGGAARINPAPGIGSQTVAVDTPAGKTFNKVRFESSPFAELIEMEPNDNPAQAVLVPVPGAISGRIAAVPSDGASDVDEVAFMASKGSPLIIEVFARRIGSPLDSVVEVLSADGLPVERCTLRAVAETYTVLRDHDSRSKGIRLQNWEDFQVNDLLMLGDELVKVQILPLGPDEDVKFFDRGGVRIGCLGSTPQAHAINSPAYKVEVHPPGSSFPPNGMPVVPLPYRNDDGGPEFSGDSWLEFDPPADGRYLVRLRDVRNLAGDNYYYRLVVRPRREDFRIALNPENPNVPRGGSLPVTVNVERLDGFTGPIDVRIEGLPPGFAATTTQIDPQGNNGVLTISAADSAQPPTGDAGLQLRAVARSQIEGHAIEHASAPAFGMHQVSLTSPPDLLVRVEPSSCTIAPGEERRFTVTIDRRNGFKGRVPIDVLNLPHGLRVLDVGLNGVLITENSSSRTFVVHCDPWARPGPLEFYAAARVEAKANERHASPPILLEVAPATK